MTLSTYASVLPLSYCRLWSNSPEYTNALYKQTVVLVLLQRELPLPGNPFSPPVPLTYASSLSSLPPPSTVFSSHAPSPWFPFVLDALFPCTMLKLFVYSISFYTCHTHIIFVYYSFFSFWNIHHPCIFISYISFAMCFRCFIQFICSCWMLFWTYLIVMENLIQLMILLTIFD